VIGAGGSQTGHGGTKVQKNGERKKAGGLERVNKELNEGPNETKTKQSKTPARHKRGELKKKKPKGGERRNWTKESEGFLNFTKKGPGSGRENEKVSQKPQHRVKEKKLH